MRKIQELQLAIKQRRYVATFECYIYADSDREALMKSKNMALALRGFDDNLADVIGLFEQNFGTFEKRDISLKG